MRRVSRLLFSSSSAHCLPSARSRRRSRMCELILKKPLLKNGLRVITVEDHSRACGCHFHYLQRRVAR